MPGEAADIAHMTEHLPRGGEHTEELRESFASLVSRAKAGDTAAFEQIMICTQHRVARVAWRMLGNTEDARDATQEVFLRTFKYLRRFDPAQDFHGWLYRITVNVCRDMARQRRRHDGESASSLEAGLTPDELNARAHTNEAEAAVVLAQRRAIVARALDTLPEKERAAIVLRDLEGLSTEEVARALGSSPATVRSQISTARAKIKTYCERFLKRRRQV